MTRAEGPAGLPGLILQDDVQSVDDTREVTQDGEQDVDEEITAASALEEDTDRREDDGKDDLADVAVLVSITVLTWLVVSPSAPAGRQILSMSRMCGRYGTSVITQRKPRQMTRRTGSKMAAYLAVKGMMAGCSVCVRKDD
jgi:hypothetical protein